MASVKPLLQFAAQTAKERILIGPSRDVGQLLFARILVALHMQGTDLEALQIAQQLLVFLEAERPFRQQSRASPGARPSREVNTRIASSTARPLRRSSRGLQSKVRKLSRIAPRMRNCA